MKKKWIHALLILGVLTTMIGVGRTYAENYDTMLEFIDAKKGSKEVALIIQRNGERIYSTNEDVALPLASMAKILVAIEYANQLESGKIKKDELVPLSELEKYYVPHTDGGAHPDWLDKIKGNHVPLSEVVKGMIRYSSNANTDYLLTRLGFDNVNAVRDQLGLTNHDELAPFGASLYVSNVVQRAYQLSEEDTLEHMRRLSKEEYSAYTHKIHKAMSNPETFKKRNFAPLLSMDFQRVWSDRLPAATANDYIKVMTFLNEKNTYSPTTQKELDEVMEWLIPDQENHEWITHLGTKGGSTEFVLTDSVYVTDKQGNKTEIVLLTNDLTPYESNFLHENWDNFLFETLTNESFRNTLK